jgi:hypothetical protein
MKKISTRLFCRDYIPILIFVLAMILPSLVRSQELLNFVDKPQLLETGDIGKGFNYYRPRWSPDGQWLSFELIDENSLRTFVAIPGTNTCFECRGKSSAASSGGLDLFSEKTGGRAAVTRLSWAKQTISNTASFCFSDEGALYKSNAYILTGKPAITPPREFISVAKMGEVGKNNGILIPEMGFTSSKSQAPVLFTDNDSGRLFMIFGNQDLKQITFDTDKLKFTDCCPKFHPTDNLSVVFVRTFEGNSDLFIIDDLNNPRATTRKLLDWPKSDEFAPTWSPDGKHIAFYSNGDGATPNKKSFDLYILDPASKGQPTLLVKNIRPDNIEEKLGPPYIGPQWIGNDVIIFAKDDNQAKDPLMYVQISTKLIETLPVGTILNDSPSICDLGDGTYLFAYTAFGKATVDLSQPDINNRIYFAKLIFSR